MNQDIVAVGASAGGVEVLLTMAASLPADFPGSIFVVLHSPPGYRSALPELMSNRGRLPASHPLHGEPISPGHIYVAVPDMHLLVRQGAMEVVRGAKENGHRPAVDALFRTASTAYEGRVVGVVLSGHQDCGTAGMLSVKARGGVSVVQSPETAAVPEMPQSVLARAPVDHVVTPDELAPLLARLATVSAGRAAPPDAYVQQVEGTRLGTPAELTCPVCQGVLTQAKPGVFEHFRCHVGHTFSLEALVREQGEEMERAMWAAVRSLEEGAALSERLAAHERGQELGRTFAEKAKTQRQQADLIREILLRGPMLGRGDAAALTQADLGSGPPRQRG
jgi:two-component system chemotaxis response regulator CheB